MYEQTNIAPVQLCRPVQTNWNQRTLSDYNSLKHTAKPEDKKRKFYVTGIWNPQSIYSNQCKVACIHQVSTLLRPATYIGSKVIILSFKTHELLWFHQGTEPTVKQMKQRISKRWNRSCVENKKREELILLWFAPSCWFSEAYRDRGYEKLLCAFQKKQQKFMCICAC